MEAVALYTFRATEGDELSFNKGDILKVRPLGFPSMSFTSGKTAVILYKLQMQSIVHCKGKQKHLNWSQRF